MNDKLEELEQELEELNAISKELQDLFDELQAEQQSEPLKRWRCPKGGRYYYIVSNGDAVLLDIECEEFEIDSNRYKIGNHFQTEEEGQKMLEKLKIYMQLYDLALKLNKGKKIDWYDAEQYKYYIYCEYEAHTLCTIETDSFQDIGQIYCLDENFLEEAKKEIGEENLIKLFE